ncbi:MAG: ATP-binding cassette domain-containing protein, partial [Evtepia sp.]
MLEIKSLTKTYNPGTVTELKLFDGLDLTVPDGQFISIVGSNGSGKTSLLNIICGSIPLDGGDVLVDGKSIRKQRDFQRYASIGRVYQNPALGTCPNLTMLENLSLADNKGKRFGLSQGVNRKRIDFYRSELAGLGLGLEDKLDVKMGSLSGGQRQAVAL